MAKFKFNVGHLWEVGSDLVDLLEEVANDYSDRELSPDELARIASKLIAIVKSVRS